MKPYLIKERTESPATDPAVATPGWMRQLAKRGLLTMDNDNEPRLTTAFWAVVVLLLAVVILALFVGWSNGEHYGIDKGRKDAQIERLVEEIKELKQNKAAENRQAENVRLARELAGNSNTETK